jgi:hypothetical protein
MKKVAFALIIAALIPVHAQALNTSELLATIAMPLAVAAVSEVSGVPQSELGDVVAMLNNAFVPAPQAIEIIRYVPVALVVDNGTPFVDFLRQQAAQGVTGTQFVTVVDQQLKTYYVESPPQIVNVVATPAPIIVNETFVPQTVRTRIVEVREAKAHPHGGPPGQLKKQAGVKTGATIVHNEPRGADKKREREVVIVPPPMNSGSPQPQQPPPGKIKVKEDHGKHGNEHGGGGKGKGHGKKN